ncbi:MAG: DUF262 domain-containing protein [Patescibacteria group bacterium]
MQVYSFPIYQFLEGSGKSFTIPVYQRDYAWTKINCQKLWDDLVDLKNNKRVDHFLGTIVTIGNGFQEYTIIDGQQRLVTVSILLISLHNFLKNFEQKSQENEILSEQILDFLINKYSSSNEKRIRLKPNKQDKEFFENLFKNEKIENFNSNIVSNYKFFYEKISSKILSPQELFDAFKKLKIVLIDLVRDLDDPQLIFESLNSTGVDLNAGDLIRNYILMDLSPENQEILYRDYWIVIEKLTGDVAEFVRNYLIFKTKIWVKKDDVYSVFKKFALENFGKNKEDILKDLVYFAEIYSFLVKIKNHPNLNLNARLERIEKLEFSVAHPYLLDLFFDLQKNILTETLVEEVLQTIESYAFRKILVDGTTQGLNKMFITLSKEIKKEGNWQENYLEILNFLLLEKRASQRFPEDSEFENALIFKEIYKFQAKNKNFLLESLENFKSVYKINLDEMSVEHIMPQTLTSDWKEKLGENWQEVHKKYLHTLGNLSLTAKNSELSNSSFEEKQKIDFQISKLKLNFKLEKISDWNEEKILERAKDLAQNAKEIWPFPKTNYSKKSSEEQIFDLTSEDNFSWSKPEKIYFEIDETGIKIKNWKEFLVNVCKFLYDFSPTEFLKIEKSEEFKRDFSDTERELRNPAEFVLNHFVEANRSTNNIIWFLSKLCKKMNYPPENISFSIK